MYQFKREKGIQVTYEEERINSMQSQITSLNTEINKLKQTVSLLTSVEIDTDKTAPASSSSTANPLAGLPLSSPGSSDSSNPLAGLPLNGGGTLTQKDLDNLPPSNLAVETDKLEKEINNTLTKYSGKELKNKNLH